MVLADLLPLFTADNVPEVGAKENLDLGGPFEWMSDTVTDPSWPGEGLKRYPMIYIGEGYNKIFIVNGGEVIWSYSTGPGYELDDIWMLKNGDILFTRMHWAAKISPDKKELWRYDCKDGEEIHTMQPIGESRCLMLINAFPARIVMFDHNTGEILWEKEIGFKREYGVHGQSRRMRYTCEDTILLSCLSENKVIEFDMDFNIIREIRADKPWAAIRLQNGNTLITLEGEARTIELDKSGEIVWEICLNEIPEKYRPGDCQSVVRLQNGNTIICSRGAGGNCPQLVEVTKEKQIVWVLKDWKNLGPATSVQILTENGISENPGDFGR